MHVRGIVEDGLCLSFYGVLWAVCCRRSQPLLQGEQ
ncbi:MAG TPA: hypothetical protein DDW33_16175 [Ktedonobacter sp.]|nr:hypothetical protein [Ktedonobacter sp.]HAH01313.1 hypothetical protein [Ktedonobacter sp.]HAT46591.1 hypothetical protein [Ktedonobacter sp.]HBE27211.1 hypothetical protein [Ktedonobacter sp.]HBE28636.1 hypothetical protein [Ktedonobacter sp.]